MYHYLEEEKRKGGKMMKKYPLKAARKVKNFTVREAATSLGLTIGELSDIEHQRRLPSLELLTEMEELYGVDLVADNRFQVDFKTTCPHCGKDFSIE